MDIFSACKSCPMGAPWQEQLVQMGLSGSGGLGKARVGFKAMQFVKHIVREWEVAVHGRRTEANLHLVQRMETLSYLWVILVWKFLSMPWVKGEITILKYRSHYLSKEVSKTVKYPFSSMVAIYLAKESARLRHMPALEHCRKIESFGLDA